MVTTQNDNRSKFLELRKQGISVADARNQTYWPPPVVPDATPTTPTPPTPPPAPTVTWVDGQQFVQAPVDPTTGLSKPIEAPTPIQAEVKPPETVKTDVASSTPTKTEPVIDYNVSAGREWEIQDNVAKITQTNPNLLKDRNAYNQAFGYETADAGKKALLDSTFSGQVKPSQDDIFNSMRAGVSVWDPKSTEFRQAQARINTFKKYSVYDTASLATSLQSGDLLVGTKAYNDLVSDPTMALKIQKAQAFNKWVVDLVKTGETQMANVLAQNTTVANALADWNLSKAEYDQLTNNDEVSAQGKLVETNKTKYETIKAQYDAVEDDVDKEFTGKEVTDSFKAKITADRRKWMYKDYQIASLEYQNSLGTYTNLKADSTALLAQNMELYKTAQAEKAQIAKEERVIQAQKDALQYEADFNKKQQEAALNDPATQIKSTLDEFAKLWIVAQWDLTSKLAEFKTSGKTLPEYISGLRTQFMSKPEYKKIQALQTGQLSEAEKLASSQSFDLKKMGISNQQDIQKLVSQYDLKNASDIQSAKIDLASKWFTTDQVDSIIRSSTGNWKWASGTTLLTAPDGTIIPSRLSQTTNKNNWKECGEYVNDITGIWLGSTWDSKKKKVDSSIVTPTIWDTAIWIPDPSNKNFAKYGHAGIVTASDWTNVTIKSSNLNGRWEISTVTVPISKITQTGWFANTSIKWTSTDKPLTDKQYTQYNQATSKFVADPNVKAFEAALAGGWDLIASLKSANWPGDVGAVFWFMKSLDPASVVKEWEFALAAKSAGVWEQFKNIPANKLEGTILTEDQRKAFWKLAFEYIKQKGKLYDIKYNDYTKILKNQWIPDTYYPTKMTDVISSVENWSSPQKSDFLNSLKSIATEFTKGLTSIK